MRNINLPENERWLADYKGRYSITSDGTVYSYIGNKHEMYGHQHRKNVRIDLTKDGKRKRFNIADLLSETFCK
jgi:hypothetical protein